MSMTRKTNSFIREISDKNLYGSYALQFAVDKAQHIMSPEEKEELRKAGYVWHNHQYYYYKKFKSLKDMHSAASVIRNLYDEYFQESAASEAPAEADPKTAKTSTKKSTKKTEPSPKTEEPEQKPVGAPKPDTDVSLMIAQLMDKLAFMQARFDSIDEKFERMENRIEQVAGC